MKNNTFNLRRFGKYFVADLRGCVANYGLTMVLISFMGLFTYLLFGTFTLAMDGAWESADGSMRSFAFLLCTCILIVNMPVKCYGMITDRKAGSSWLMIPASTFEKFLSMVIMTALVVPSVTIGTYLLTDMIICKADPACGTTLVSMIRDLFDILGDLIQISLVFLLGAIFFKSGKTSKTILSVIVLAIVFSMAATPVMSHMFSSFTADLQMETPENLNNLFSTGLFRHAALIDTVNDTLGNLALLAGIFFRVKTLKH